MRPLARWGTLPLLAAPVGTWALGLGEIELHSALNQRLDAEIELVSATPEELASLDISLAPLASFQRYGLERPAFLNSIVFELGRNAAGRNVIRVSSTQSISEPFVTMLVEAEWGRGRLLREYTVFLDPPVLLPGPSALEPVEPAQSRVAEPSAPAGPISRAAPEPAAPTPAPAPQRVARAPASPASPNVSEQIPPAADGGNFGPVQSGATLWGIASNYRPNGVSVNQAMVAIYRANPQAFGGNMNLLRRGAILRIPPSADMSAVSTADATAEVRRQNDAWRGGAAGDTSATPQQRLVLTPPTEATIEATAGGGSAGAGADAGEVAALRSQVADLEARLEESNRLLSVRSNELAELQDALAANDVDDLAAVIDPEPAAADPGIELESEELFVDGGESADAAAIADAQSPAADAAAVPAEAEAVAPAEPAGVAPAPSRVPAATTTTGTSSPSLIDRILGALTSTVALIGGGVVLILLGAFVFLRRRRQEVEDATGQWEALEAELDETDEEVAATARMRAQSAAADDTMVVEEGRAPAVEIDDVDTAATGSFERTGSFDAPEAAPAAEELPEETMTSQTLSSQTVINLDQADPIAEADFHMAYGLYDQAADLISKAVEADPENVAYRLKLLEVFFVWGNKESFIEAARALKDELGAESAGEWAKVIIMGKQICPDDPLFADAQAEAGNVDLDLEAGDAPGLDLAFDGGEDQSVDLDLGSDDEVDLDFGVADSSEMALEETMESGTVDIGGLDQDAGGDDTLDIGERTQAGLEAALFEIDEDEDESEASRTSPGVDIVFDDTDIGETQESPTVETFGGDFSFDDEESATTMETPTIESPSLTEGEAPTVETPTIETAGPVGGESEQGSELTAELDLGDLGLDVEDIDALDSDLGELPQAADAESDTRAQPVLGDDDELLSATGVTQVLTQEDIEENDLSELTGSGLEAIDTALLPDDEETMMAPGFGEDKPAHVDTEVIARPEAESAGADNADDDGLDLDLDDFSEALQGSDTVEQPRAEFDESMFGSDAADTPLDLDVGNAPIGDDDPTGTEAMGPLDAQTMTEVGTKLDLARAYIDMGDPEGAKSILEEVLSEGDSGQREEAQSLIDALPA